MAFILILLICWGLIGGLLLVGFSRSKNPAKFSITRNTNKRICLVGDSIPVDVTCSTVAFPPPSEAIEEEIQLWDIVLVLDHSSSMGSGIGSALEAAKQAALTMVRTLPRDFRFAVVEFDHEAQELQRLSLKSNGLERAIKRINGGGATDIGLALQVTAQCLTDEETTVARKVAIILLSDGESERDSALAAADELKSRDDLLLVTVGLGSSDNLLLRYIASEPKYYYQADNIEALTELYQQIGQMITAKHASQVKISSTFDHQGNWGLRGWGDIKPVHKALGKGEFSWLLPTLDHEQINLNYTLEALRPGWHKIALTPATLQAYWDTDELQIESKGIPRVLVLPSIPGWQFLSLLLNPLWFLLFGKFYRRNQSTALMATQASNEIIPLALPPQISIPPSPLANITLRPTLVIGLGFGGTHSMVHCKRLAWERGERIDSERLRFLAIDTANPLFFPTPTIGSVTLNNSERLHLKGRLEPVIQTETQNGQQNYPWLPARQIMAGGARPDLQQGTGHQRTLGRLAVFVNKELLISSIQPLLVELLEADEKRNIDILITGTTAGGTSSGMLLDLCWLLRCILAEMGESTASINLFLSAPVAAESVTLDQREKDLRNANHQALMSELDRVDVMRGQLLAPMQGMVAQRNWFDSVVCVGQALQQPLPAFTDLYPKTGEMLFSWFAAGGEHDLHRYFQTLQETNRSHNSSLEHCRVHRVEPNSLYLYPRTLKRYLVVERLRRSLAQIVWTNEGDLTEYQAFVNPVVAAATLLSAWKDNDEQLIWLPWVAQAGSVFENAEQMHERLLIGAGPGISCCVSPLGHSEFIKEQKTILENVLGSWLSNTLNQGLGELCQPHALAVNLQALELLYGQLIQGGQQARHLLDNAVESMVQSEAGLVVELSEQGAASVQSKINYLLVWDQYLGEGINQPGVMRYLDYQLGLLQQEVEKLQVQASPKLPLNWNQINALSDQIMGPVMSEFMPRLQWQLASDKQSGQWQLALQGIECRYWRIEDLVQNDSDVNPLAESLIQLAEELSNDLNKWQLADHLSDEPFTAKIAPPRVNGLNRGAKGLYLKQGQYPIANRDSEITELTTLEPQHECRVIACEQNLSTALLWEAPKKSAALPFIFNEEFYGYQAYERYCQEHGLTAGPLPPALLALCRQPVALLDFAIRGLVGKCISEEQDDYQARWVANLPEGQQIALPEGSDSAIDTLLRVATAWGELIQGDGELAIEDTEPFVKALKASELLRRVDVEDERFVEAFIGVVCGMGGMG